MKRRQVLHLALGVAAAAVLQGHTPFRQWIVYRKRRLLIGSSKADPSSYVLSKQVAETLITNLPESKARASRAPNVRRLASLLATDQLDVSILAAGDAAALMEGRAPFADFGGVPLRSLFTFGDHLLVSRPEFPRRFAYLVSQTLSEHPELIPGSRLIGPIGKSIPVHEGTLAYGQGRPVPAAEED